MFPFQLFYLLQQLPVVSFYRLCLLPLHSYWLFNSVVKSPIIVLSLVFPVVHFKLLLPLFQKTHPPSVILGLGNLIPITNLTDFPTLYPFKYYLKLLLAFPFPPLCFCPTFQTTLFYLIFHFP